jgi:hypothetical protein
MRANIVHELRISHRPTENIKALPLINRIRYFAVDNIRNVNTAVYVMLPDGEVIHPTTGEGNANVVIALG